MFFYTSCKPWLPSHHSGSSSCALLISTSPSFVFTDSLSYSFYLSNPLHVWKFCNHFRDFIMFQRCQGHVYTNPTKGLLIQLISFLVRSHFLRMYRVCLMLRVLETNTSQRHTVCVAFVLPHHEEHVLLWNGTQSEFQPFCPQSGFFSL